MANFRQQSMILENLKSNGFQTLKKWVDGNLNTMEW